ncbi:MAG TPA: PQQ-binding-like beta-propeller repeat protein, partial [Pirellulales bacterium]|nr:PQQ-binding-like beta-propeller repeat protein [Pirellulales bacterium]
MSLRHHAAVLIGLGFVVSSATADDWTRFRGSDGSGISSSSKHPSEWSEDSNVAWKTKIPGRGWSQPVIAGDNVFLTTAFAEGEEKPRRFDGGVPGDAKDPTTDDYQWKVFCLSLKTGEVLWERTPFEGKPPIR